MLPRRGDPKSRFVIAVAVVCFLAFWSLAVWVPIGGFIAFSLAASELRFGRWGAGEGLVAICLAGGLAAIVARAVARGIVSGHRVAYVVVGLLLFGVAGLHAVLACVRTPSMAVLAMSRSVVFFCLALVVTVLAIRQGVDGDESGS